MKEGNAEEKYVRILYPDELSALDKRVIGKANVSVLTAIEQTSSPEKKLMITGRHACSFFGTNEALFIDVDEYDRKWRKAYYVGLRMWEGMADFTEGTSSEGFYQIANRLISREACFYFKIESLHEDFPDDYRALDSHLLADAICVSYNGARRGFFVIKNPTDNIKYGAYAAHFMNYAKEPLQTLWIKGMTELLNQDLRPVKENDLVCLTLGGSEYRTIRGELLCREVKQYDTNKYVGYLLTKPGYRTSLSDLAESVSYGRMTDNKDNNAVVRSAVKRFMVKCRKVLGETPVILTGDDFVEINPYYDVIADICIVRQIISLIRVEKDMMIRLGLIERLLSLYRGNFLPEYSDEHWVMVTEQEFRMYYMNSVALRGEYLIKNGDKNGVVANYISALKAHPHEISLYIRSAEALWRNGQEDNAMMIIKLAEDVLDIDEWDQLCDDIRVDSKIRQLGCGRLLERIDKTSGLGS